MSVTIHNGRPQPHQRKQLSDQLDRFDQILDGLADALNGAMADAARDGTRLAVKDAILEILTNPDLKAAIQGTATATKIPVSPASPSSAWDRFKAIIRRTRAMIVSAVRRTWNFVTNKIRATTSVAAGASRMTIAAWKMKRAVLVAAGVGVGLGVGAYYSTPHAGVLLSAAAGAIVAVAVRTALWVRSALRAILPA